jgi:hypothetical protein
VNPIAGLKALRGSSARRKESTRWRASVEGLEPRSLMTASPQPNIAMTSASTADSLGVTFAYQVEGAAITRPVTFGVYRSADDRFDPSDIPIGSVTVEAGGPGQATLDTDGKPAMDFGTHRITLPLADGLPPNPDHPYVLVVADPKQAVAETSKSDNTAAFRTYVIGVVTHGGIQPKKWKAGPPWELRMARDLRGQGYDAVIPYNWVIASNHPGSAVRQGPRLARMVLKTASLFPESAPVDLHFIGHSEGAVVNDEAIRSLEQDMPPQLKAGYVKVTMLDPHSANTGVKGQQYSVANGFLGWVAKMTIDRFQSKAKDPAVVVPPGVDDTEVFYQHTPVSQAETNDGLYNLWGQVPIHGPAHYFDLTGRGISHAGKFGVQDWYRLNVVPTLGEGSPLANANVLTVSQDPRTLAGTANGADVAVGRRPIYGGIAAPGATVSVLATRAGSSDVLHLGRTDANAAGDWSLTARALPQGRYKIKALADAPKNAAGKVLHMRPTAWADPLIVDARGSRR